MADTFTENYGLTKPEPGTSGWDAKLNAVINAIDQIMYGWGWEPQGVVGVVQALITQVNVTGDVLADYPTKRRIKAVGATSGVHYGIIGGGSYGGGITTLIVLLDSGALTAGESATLYKTIWNESGSAMPLGLHRANEGAATGDVLEWNGNYFVPMTHYRFLKNITTIATSPYTLNESAHSSNLLNVNAASFPVQVNLPLISTVQPGWGVVVMKTDASANIVQLDGAGSETINGASVYTLTARYSTVTVVSDGTEWKIIASRL